MNKRAATGANRTAATTTAAPDAGPDARGLTQADLRRRLIEVQLERSAVRLRQTRGELLEVAAVRKEIASIAAALRQRLETCPSAALSLAQTSGANLTPETARIVQAAIAETIEMAMEAAARGIGPPGAD